MSRMCWLTWIRDNTRAPCPCHISEPHKATSMVLKVFYYHNSISLRFPFHAQLVKGSYLLGNQNHTVKDISVFLFFKYTIWE